LPPVLITGETGSGKSTIARWIHQRGPRANGTLVEVNCSALPETLAESELFGHERGAFTDARTARQGLFEAAHGGTLFLDELPSLSPALQAKVLMALEDGNRQIELDVRVIAATSRDLRAAVAAGEFREDLLHRLDLYRVALPPLRDRANDILHLAEHLLRQLCRRHRLPPREITETGKQRLLTYEWPGNVRELAHEIERALVFSEGALLNFAHLPVAGAPTGNRPETAGDWLCAGFRFPEHGFSLEDAINRFVQLALRDSGNNVSAAARRLGVTRDFVRYRLFGDRKSDLASGAKEGQSDEGKP
jgi:DNA-binding NtrC family response regulator